MQIPRSAKSHVRNGFTHTAAVNSKVYDFLSGSVFNRLPGGKMNHRQVFHKINQHFDPDVHS